MTAPTTTPLLRAVQSSAALTRSVSPLAGHPVIAGSPRGLAASCSWGSLSGPVASAPMANSLLGSARAGAPPPSTAMQMSPRMAPTPIPRRPASGQCPGSGNNGEASARRGGARSTYANIPRSYFSPSVRQVITQGRSVVR
jgi:hypothetical protein